VIHILAALAVLGLLIAIHEAGHFLAATGQGIRVSSFSIGLGPRLVGWRRRGVQFALRAIPIGGYVAFPDPESEEGRPACNRGTMLWPSTASPWGRGMRP